jgi:hypothetical protein
MSLNAQQCAPRFAVRFEKVRYDDRDVAHVVGYISGPSFYTAAMAERWLSTNADESTLCFDLHPERDLANWGPVQKAPCPECGVVNGHTENCLPF